MARDIEKRLSKLRERRSGTDRLAQISQSEWLSTLAKSRLDESYQKRATKPYTRYALGAMQEVDTDYTRISIETAERVGKQLTQALAAQGEPIELRLQGSVPLNVHIRGVSDVDLLTLHATFHTYTANGRLHQQGLYSPTSRTSIGVLQSIRTKSERALREAYQAASVDTSGSKAIRISGGSLLRPVDVVPSHWHDNLEYQISQFERDRGVTILDRDVPTTIGNLPFLHIARVTDRCNSVGGGLRKAIRLCKNVKADAENEGRTIQLPSFDIAAMMYHANQTALLAGVAYELAILAETQRHLDYLHANKDYARTLLVPDGSRRIFDTEQKLEGLTSLSLEMDDLLREVAKEQNAQLATTSSPALAECRAVVASTYVG